MNYTLDENGTPIPEENLKIWAKWFSGDGNRTVAKERIGDVLISTVFLGIDHAFGAGDPVLWETMVFGGEFDQDQDRCTGNRSDALAMHARMVGKVSR